MGTPGTPEVRAPCTGTYTEARVQGRRAVRQEPPRRHHGNGALNVTRKCTGRGARATLMKSMGTVNNAGSNARMARRVRVTGPHLRPRRHSKNNVDVDRRFLLGTDKGRDRYRAGARRRRRPVNTRRRRRGACRSRRGRCKPNLPKIRAAYVPTPRGEQQLFTIQNPI